MTLKRPAIVPPEVWEQAPEPVRVVMHAMVEYYEQRIAKLEAEVRELTARLNQNSQNSSKPPSSEDLVQFANRRRARVYSEALLRQPVLPPRSVAFGIERDRGPRCRTGLS